jgi:hypothetical protein
MKLLITLGCSWTHGVGVNYEPGMTKKEYLDGCRDLSCLNQYSFRALLSQEYNMYNVDLSLGGSSNQQQFRLAENFFSSPSFAEYQKEYSEIVVLWGITSIFRNEIYHNKIKDSKSYFYNNESLLSKAIISDHFDSQYEMTLLYQKIIFWNKFFDLMGIKNLWFDTFNHHKYILMPPTYAMEAYKENAGPSWPSWEQFITGDLSGTDIETQEEILDKNRWIFYRYFYNVELNRIFKGPAPGPRDLLSQMAIQYGMSDMNDNYHLSAWVDDCDRIAYLTKLGLLNPHSNHPTKSGHRCIADMLSSALPINRGDSGHRSVS